MHDPSKKAVCCLVISGRKVLGVSRKHDPDDFGLPGGKVDPGESLEEAAVRELAEETGLSGRIIRHVFTDYDDHEWLVSTFQVEASGEIDTDEEGTVKWCSPEELVDNTSFAWYNSNVLQKVGLMTDGSSQQYESAKRMIAFFIAIIFIFRIIYCYHGNFLQKAWCCIF